MPPETPSTNGAPDPSELPPVTPPSAGFILQLFLVPGILVALVVGLIWFFFGWLGSGPRTPEEFINGLKSRTRERREKTAEHLAQVLKRDDRLARDVSFALDLAELLHQTIQKPIGAESTPVEDEKDDKEAAALAAEFLPAALGSFFAPVGMPLFQEIIDQTDGDDWATRVRRRGAVWAIALLGEKMKKYDGLPEPDKEQILASLEDQAGEGPRRTGRQMWAQAALDYLKYRETRRLTAGKSPALRDPFGVAETLKPCARSPDEMTRKLTALALAMWFEPGTEVLLAQLAGPNQDVRFYEDESDRERGRREISYNAALALARRGSRHTPKDLVLEALNESKQREFYVRNEGMADQTLVAALAAVAEMKQASGDELDPQIHDAVQALAHSPNIRVQVEAKKILGTATTATAVSGRLSREALWAIGLGTGVLFLLTLAVVARWRRRPAPADTITLEK